MIKKAIKLSKWGLGLVILAACNQTTVNSTPIKNIDNVTKEKFDSTYYENGKLKSVTIYKLSEKSRLQKEYDSNGVLMREIPYTDDISNWNGMVKYITQVVNYGMMYRTLMVK